jgi:hypothetical protein
MPPSQSTSRCPLIVWTGLSYILVACGGAPFECLNRCFSIEFPLVSQKENGSDHRAAIEQVGQVGQIVVTLGG